MPIVSKAQQRWMFANKPEMGRRWAKETPDMKNLPNRVHKRAHHSMLGVILTGKRKKSDCYYGL